MDMGKTIRRIKKCYLSYITTMADETCDITVIEQLCICLRYFNPSSEELVERIIRLCEINSQTGEVSVTISLY